ncbi:nucleoside-diphosphate-sugar epimerase [Litorimonas taeanensis]|uniref:Nucleoside-diphosphate-sugar epimerase n=1 Tax=Litorimonas taeanensis TaxID=568099 RepID=A0A420WKN4_9PROT|nr:NAD-dependent epimerase/dehydratase family protein [Litorimonas taeanensis]RKQ71560.1 nucleoside-diphosphate-sugar epimerase [Litorimonas taeanensis]
MPQLIALTGATGFLGRHLLHRLLADGHKVRALARNPSALAEFCSPNLEVIKGDLTSDLSCWGQSADCVIHLAGLVKARNWDEFETVNIDGARAVAVAAEKLSVPRVILMSSMTARAPQLSLYAKSKSLGEKAVTEVYSQELAIIRAPAVFGPGDSATKPIFDLMGKGLLPTVGGKGWRHRSVAMVYVSDLVDDIVLRALRGDYDGTIVSPSTIGAVSMPEFAEFGRQATGKSIRAFPIPLFLIFPIAAVTTITLRLCGWGHLSLGKLAEFRYERWQSNDRVTNPTPMQNAIGETMRSYDLLDTI